MRAATIYDVARHAGVSHQTVSRLLRGYEGIRPETRARVEAALAELEYRPNSAARLLRTRRTNRIGVLAHRIDQTGPARILAGATQAAQQRGYVLDIVVTGELDEHSIDAGLAVLTDHQVAGILATAQTDSMVARIEQQSASVPLVIDTRIDVSEGGPSINEVAGRLAAAHLVELGHRRVGYVSGPTDWIASAGRLAGFRRRIEEAGGRVEWVRAGDWSSSSGYAAWSTLSPADRSVTAVALANDSMAIGFIAAAVGDGVRVPEDCSVIGTDDLDEAQFLLPALSTIAVDFEGEGRFMLGTLLARVGADGGSVSGEVEAPTPIAPPRIVARGSSRAV